MMSIINAKCLRIARTCNLYLSFFALGLCVAIPGPTLLDLQHAINTDTEHIAFIYTSRSTGYLVGSVFGGMMYDMVPCKQTVLIGCNLLMTLSTLITPWCRSLLTLVITMAASGISLGVLDTGGNVWCLNLWGKDSGPFFQALHFTFGVGGLVAPLIAAPFLSESSREDISSANITNETFPGVNSSIANETWNNYTFSPSSTFPTITYAYSIIGAFCVLVSLMFIIMYILAPEDNCVKKDDENQIKEPGRMFTCVVIVVTGLLLSVYVGTEIGFAQMLTTYAVKGNLKLSKATGSYMTSAYWASFTACRGISIFLAIRYSSFTLMAYDLVITLAASIILLTLGTVYESWLWFGSVLLGIGIASFFPSAISWIERYINVTSKVASMIVIGCAAGEMVIPLVISMFIETVPEVLFYLVLTSTLSCCFFTILLYFVLSKKGEKYVSDQ